MKRIVTILALYSMLMPGASGLLAQSRSERPREIDPKPFETKRHLEAFTDGRSTAVKWATSGDRPVAGFHIYSLSEKGLVRINPDVIPGDLSMHERSAKEYEKVFGSGLFGAAYLLETLYADGSVERSDPFIPKYVPNGLRSIGIRSRPDSAVPGTSSVIESTRPVIPAEIASERGSYEMRPDRIRQAAISAAGGAKIGIKQTGMYKVSRSQLQAAGFDVDGPSANWQLYVDGIEQPMNVGPGGQYIEFYARSIDTPECDIRVYYLVNGSSEGKRITTRITRPSNGTQVTQSYIARTIFKERNNFDFNIINGEAENWWGRLFLNSPTTYNFQLRDPHPATGKATFKVRFQGWSTAAHNVNLALNGEAIDGVSANGTVPFGTNEGIPISRFQNGSNALQMSTTSSSDGVFFDSIDIEYRRPFRAVSGRLDAYTEPYRNADLSNFPNSSVRVFDVTNENEPTEYGGLVAASGADGFGVRLPANPRGRIIAAVTDSTFLSPASITPNEPSDLRVNSNNAELVIIAHKDWWADAQAWAAYRQSQGITVKIVDEQDIYDEFSFGLKYSLAIRSFLFYAKNNWAGPPNYVLLMGGASINPKEYDLSPDDQGYPNFVPTKIVNTVYSETGSDETLADFDNNGLAEIAIGRIPAREPGDAAAALAKTIAFEAGIPYLDRGAVFAYDLPVGYDFGAMSQRIRNQLPQNIPTSFVGRGDPNAQATVIAAQNAGRYLVNYSGHGTAGVWAAASFFGNPSVGQLTNSQTPSVYTLLTCLNGYFLNLYAYSLGENLLESSNGGAAAVWASTGKTTPDVQELMATRFYQKITQGKIRRLGDLINDAKSVLPSSSDVRLSWALLGDPMLKMN